MEHAGDVELPSITIYSHVVGEDGSPETPLIPHPPSSFRRRHSRDNLAALAAPGDAPASAQHEAPILEEGTVLPLNTYRRKSRDLTTELGIEIAEAAKRAVEGATAAAKAAEAEKPKLKRTALTWLLYMGPAYYSYLQALLGPIMPFLESELKINYSTAGLHFSAFASGCVLCGLSGDFLVRTVGRKKMFWIGSSGLTLAALVFAVCKTVVLTISCCLAMGWLGTFALSTSTAALSDRHFAHRSIVLAESLVFCCLFAYLAPIMVGFTETYFPRIGWRLSIFVSIGFFALVAAAFGRVKWDMGEETPSSPRKAGSPKPEAPKSSRLPLSFWGYAAIVFLSCSHEWILIYWGSIHMEADLGLSKVAAATNMNFFLLAMTAGRVVGSRLAARFPPALMLIAFLAANLAGFVAFWLMPHPLPAVAGLVVAGLGMSNQYPFAVSLGLGSVPKALTDSASSRLMFSGGAAVLFGSQGLGFLADRMDMRRAMLFPCLLIAPAIPLAAVLRSRCRAAAMGVIPGGEAGKPKYHLLSDEAGDERDVEAGGHAEEAKASLEMQERESGRPQAQPAPGGPGREREH